MTSDERRKADEARREYHRRWRAKNKDKIQQYNAEYWLKKISQAEKEQGET